MVLKVKDNNLREETPVAIVYKKEGHKHNMLVSNTFLTLKYLTKKDIRHTFSATMDNIIGSRPMPEGDYL